MNSNDFYYLGIRLWIAVTLYYEEGFVTESLNIILQYWTILKYDGTYLCNSSLRSFWSGGMAKSTLVAMPRKITCIRMLSSGIGSPAVGASATRHGTIAYTIVGSSDLRS